MNVLSINVILISFIIIQEFYSIDGSVEQIYEKVKQEVEDLIDSQDYESVNDILKDSKVKIKYFDYYVPTTYKPTPLTTPTPLTAKGSGVSGQTRDASDVAPAQEGKNDVQDGGGGGGSGFIVIGVILVVVVIIVIGGGVGIFFYIKKSKTGMNKNVKKIPKRSGSRQSLESIQTVASDTGKPIHPPSKSVVAPKKK